MNQRAYWSFGILFFSWLYFFWPTLILYFQKSQPISTTLLEVVIIVSSLYIVFKKSNELKRVAFSSSQLGLLCFFILAVIWVLAGVSRLVSVQQTVVILMLPALVLTALGPHVAKVLLFPLLYLLLLIPIEDKTIPYSGLIAWMAFGILYAYFRYQRATKRLIFIAVTVSVSIISFCFSKDWRVSILLIIVLVGLGLLMSERKDSYSRYFWNEQPGRRIITQSSRWLFPTSVAFCLIVSSPFLSDNIRDFYEIFHKKVVLIAPAGVDNWRGPRPVTLSNWQPIFKNATATLQVEYYQPLTLDLVYLYTAYYQSSRTLDDLLDSSNSLYNKEIWQEVKYESKSTKVNKQNVQVIETILKNGNETRLQWAWYFVSGFSGVEVTYLKLLDTVRLISKYANGPGVIVISTSMMGDPESARLRLTNFLQAMSPSLAILEQPEKVQSLK